MSEQIDIINLDSKIRENFIDEIAKIDIYKDRLENIITIISDIESNIDNSKPKFYTILVDTKKELEVYIDNLTNQSNFNFYIIATSHIIEEYQKLLKIPLKINFMGKPQRIIIINFPL